MKVVGFRIPLLCLISKDVAEACPSSSFDDAPD